MVQIRPVLVFLILLACSIHQIESFRHSVIPRIDQVLEDDEQLKCRFELHEYVDGYVCYLENSFTRPDTKISEVNGSHVGGLTNADVRRFRSFYNSNLKFLPITLGRFFPNLIVYEVQYSGLEEISRKNFADLPTLTSLSISGNGQLRMIPADAFYDLPNLGRLDLWVNQIEAIDSATFIHNPKLEYINLQNNRIRSLDSSLFRNNLELEFIIFSNNVEISTIGSELLTPLKNLNEVDFRGNRCIDRHFWNNGIIMSPSEREEFRQIFVTQCRYNAGC